MKKGNESKNKKEGAQKEESKKTLEIGQKDGKQNTRKRPTIRTWFALRMSNEASHQRPVPAARSTSSIT
jgi:hypothetical protein